MARSPGQTPRKKLTDSRRGKKDLVLTFYAGVEEEGPRVSEQQKTVKDTRKIRILEKIKRDREAEYEKFMERAYSKGPAQSVAGSHRKN